MKKSKNPFQGAEWKDEANIRIEAQWDLWRWAVGHDEDLAEELAQWRAILEACPVGGRAVKRGVARSFWELGLEARGWPKAWSDILRLGLDNPRGPIFYGIRRPVWNCRNERHMAFLVMTHGRMDRAEVDRRVGRKLAQEGFKASTDRPVQATVGELVWCEHLWAELRAMACEEPTAGEALTNAEPRGESSPTETLDPEMM